MKKLDTADRVRILACLVEGCSIRATCRLTGFAKNTVAKFVIELGGACQRFHDATVRGLDMCERVQADEVWCFVGAKDKNIPENMKHLKGTGYMGSAWTWTALCADTKLMLCWHAGTRDVECARHFMLDLAGRVTKKIQLTTDGHAAYRLAVPEAFGREIHFAQLVKHYAEPRQDEARYSPCICTGATKTPRIGWPKAEDVSTSHVERSNLTLRMQNRRFTRLTNAFSKRLANLRASLSILYVHYNFARIHQTLRVTPAMEAGIAKHVWELSEIVGLLEAEENAVIGTEANKRGPYRKGGDAA
jgi:IS1 family transposase